MATVSNKKGKKRGHKVFAIMPIVVIVVAVYGRLTTRESYPDHLKSAIAEIVEPQKLSEQFQCQGKVDCSEMTSYDEALFYLRNCPGKKMDGDNEGDPCDYQF